MRNQETWERQVRPKIIQQLPPRIQRDLENINDLPKITNLDSAYVWGDIRTGKTVYAAQWFLEAARKRFLEIGNYQVLFVSTPELIQQIQNSFDNPELHRADILNTYSKAQYLVMDDLGVEKPTEFVVNTLYLIINYRYEYLLPTLITSNYTLDLLADRLNGDERIPSRIQREYKIREKEKKW